MDAKMDKMAEEKEKTVQKTYRLPVGLIEFIDLLVARRIYGSNGSAVVRQLLNNAYKDMVETGFVKKHFETMELLRQKDHPGS
jgi:Arc/MetJ-type ribon-helix-helix transcriptional regulator